MKVKLLGHASVFIEMRATRCLMDPVFVDPFEDGAACHVRDPRSRSTRFRASTCS